MKARLPGPLARRAFPYARPPWPASVGREPAKSQLGVEYDTEWSRRYPTRLGRAMLLDFVARPMVQAIAAPRRQGLDRLEGVHPPVIFASNHASHLDTPLLLTSLPERFRHRTVVAAGADYFFDKRWKATFWSFTLAAIPVERTRVSRRSADLPVQLIDDGWNLVIFPEGGRTPDGWVQPFRGGAAYVAIRAGVPVVPIHLEGTRRVLRKGGRRLRLANTTVTFGAPMRPDEGEDARRFAARIERAVGVLADEQATDWWTARRRAAGDRTPSLSGPDAGAWRRAWALGEDRRAPVGETPWPKL